MSVSLSICMCMNYMRFFYHFSDGSDQFRPGAQPTQGK